MPHDVYNICNTRIIRLVSNEHKVWNILFVEAGVLIFICKSREISHGGCALNGFVSGENIIIVDDFIASGETMIYLLGHTKSFTLRREKMSSIV